jgi:ATP phosphoribosyltransferase
VRIVLAVAGDSTVERADQLPPESKISTEYPTITQRTFEKLGIPVRIFTSYGATEAKVPEIVDAIVELTETGSTLRRHGMRIVETLLESQTVLIANRAAHADAEKRQAMRDLETLLTGALAARGKVLVKLNVSEDNLDRVLEILPAMKSPTVSRLSQEHDFAVETVVEKSRINTLIPQLKDRGATDIIELPISKIVP